MDEASTIRHRVLVQGVSRRAVANEMGVSRNTVRRYLTSGVPVKERRLSERPRPVIESAKARLEALLTDSPRWTAGKQRLTATQLWRLLRAEGVAIGATSVKVFMREWKRQRAEVFVRSSTVLEIWGRSTSSRCGSTSRGCVARHGCS